MAISAIMTPKNKLTTTYGDADLASLRAVFSKALFQHVPVVDGANKVIGIVSVKDYFKELSPVMDSASDQTLSVFIRSRKVHQVMASPVITIRPEATVREASLLLLQHNISCLLVTDSQQHLLGLLSWKDIMRAALLAKPKT